MRTGLSTVRVLRKPGWQAWLLRFGRSEQPGSRQAGRDSKLMHGLIKRAGKRYRYYLTDFGCQVATLALKLREMVIIFTAICRGSLGWKVRDCHT